MCLYIAGKLFYNQSTTTMEGLLFDKKTGTLKHEKNRKLPVLINSNDVLVKVVYSGVCGTDLHIIEV